MKSLKTEDRLIKKILASELSLLIVSDDQSLSVDDVVEFISSSNIAVGTGLVDEVTIKRLSDISNSDPELKDQLDYLEAGGSDIKKPVQVIRFKFEPYKEPKKVTYSHGDLHESLKMFSDGGSRGNPGPSASGYVLLTTDDKVVKRAGVYLGVTTNNQAEYKSLKFGLEDAKNHGAKRVSVFMDSQLVINQMNGVYKIKNRDLLPIFRYIKELETKFDEVTFTHVPREFNKLADAEVNKALDAEIGE